MPAPAKVRPQHTYDRRSKFVMTAAYAAFYGAVVVPMLGKSGGVTRAMAYPMLYTRMLRQIERLNHRWDRLAGADRKLRLNVMFNCPIPGCLQFSESTWYCRDRYVCPFCYGRSIINDFDYLKSALPAEPYDDEQQLYVCTQTLVWPKALDAGDLADYLTRFTHAAAIYAQRYVPVDGPVGLIRDIPSVRPMPAVSRVLVWPSLNQTDETQEVTAHFAMIGLRPHMPDGMRRLGKWVMPVKIRREISANPPDVFQVGDPDVKTLLKAVTSAFRYPHQLFTQDPDHTAEVLNAVTGKRLRMVRRIGKTDEGENHDDA